MKTLVIGGNGFVGSAVVRALIAHGHAVRCLLRTTSTTGRIDDLAVERVTGDIREPASLHAALDGCDAVIHLASPSAWDQIDSPLMQAVVVDGTRNLLAALAERRARGRVCRMVYVSTAAAVNGSERPQSFDESAAFTLDERRFRYVACKREAERLCGDAVGRGQPVVIVNPAEVYGPHDHGFVTAGNLLEFLRQNPVLVCAGGTSIVHVDDVALGIVRALERGTAGERYILGGENLGIAELARLCLELAGRRARIIELPRPPLRALAALGRRLALPLPFNPSVIPYATRYWYMNAAKAETELGLRFRDARAVLEPTIAWLRAAGHLPVRSSVIS
ncbi:MAG: NAD-dependent epimerase/dehydratase family protein [Chromatiales bacterium]|jgi:dihydroflavonol-4-reductase|nr:NAD-dependent epimerase/dehydratase family protein [Chromatiales bacterium]MDX9767155.1 NAD-dependent epimerase/dehydratase family protein [Ectothiorhodospiraceae bacterium]